MIVCGIIALNFVIQVLCRHLIKLEEEKESLDTEECKFNDFGTSLNEQDIFVCDIKMGDG